MTHRYAKAAPRWRRCADPSRGQRSEAPRGADPRWSQARMVPIMKLPLKSLLVTLWVTLWVTLLAFATACGGVQVRADAGDVVPPSSRADSGAGEGLGEGEMAADLEVTVYDFEPTLVFGSVHEDGTIVTSSADLPELFAEAGDYLRAGDHENAARLYRLILENYEDESYVRVTHYNLGLAYERMDLYERALPHYRTIVEQWIASEDATWAMYRMAECYSQLGYYEEIPRLMEAVLPRGGLHLIDRLEAHLRAGNAHLELRQYRDAERHFDRVQEMNDRALMRWRSEEPDFTQEPLGRDHAIVAQALFGRARIYHELFLEIRLVLPEARLTQDLLDKGQLFEQAQASYLDCLRGGHRYWAPAAGFMVGKLYEDFYFDVLATEIPHDFNEIELEVYFEELRAFIEPAMRRAMNIYENNLAMAYRLGSDNVWVDDTLGSIHRLQRYLVDHEGWEAEQQLIIEQRHHRSARFADTMVFRSEMDNDSRSARSRDYNAH